MMASSYKDEDGHISVSGSGAAAGGGSLRTKKPENTAFKQQRLPAWQPILTAGTVLPAFFIIGLIFIPIGIGLYVTSNNIKEFEVAMFIRETPVNQSNDTILVRCGLWTLQPKSIHKSGVLVTFLSGVLKPLLLQ
ncbi:Cell cycle control protein 50A [Xenotaenia resolanae]|uniref:Cell cycle control protein 50A n=1 Tax=Xenotaenia resolanae TaxID=208358 RepID=A0ABV0WHW7_9TELE